MLKAHLHGYLMEYKHYEALRSVVESGENEDGGKSRPKDKFEKLKEDRIILQKVAPRVNKAYAKELMNKSEANPKKGDVAKILDDQRFGKMFVDPDFTVNKKSEEFKRSHPNFQPKQDEPADEEPEKDEEELEEEDHEILKVPAVQEKPREKKMEQDQEKEPENVPEKEKASPRRHKEDERKLLPTVKKHKAIKKVLCDGNMMDRPGRRGSRRWNTSGSSFPPRS